MADNIKMIAVARAMKARSARTVIMIIGSRARATFKAGTHRTHSRGIETQQDRHHQQHGRSTSSVVTTKGAELIMERAPRRDKLIANAREKDLELRGVTTR